MLFGSHLSVAGGMVNALIEAKRLKMDCVQVFTKNQRQWNAPLMSTEARTAWLDELRRMSWDSIVDDVPARVVSHNTYLINVASPDPTLWKKSVAAQRDEIERCESLNIRLCVMHPGAHLSGSRPVRQPNDLSSHPTADELAGLNRIIKALDQIHRDLPGYRTLTCLETTVGAGTHLGYNFHQLACLRHGVSEPDRIGFCFDTCHVTAAGYDMSTSDQANAVIEHFDDFCGLSNLRVFHLNDSMGSLGSRLDRHAHIGLGTCGLDCFRTIVNHSAFAGVPMILETPKECDDKGRQWDVLNIRRLKRMVRRQAVSR